MKSSASEPGLKCSRNYEYNCGWRMKEDRCGDAIFVNAKRGAEKKVWKEKPNIIIIWPQSNACPGRYRCSALASQQLIGSWSFCRCIWVLHRYRRCQWFKWHSYNPGIFRSTFSLNCKRYFCTCNGLFYISYDAPVLSTKCFRSKINVLWLPFVMKEHKEKGNTFEKITFSDYVI